LWWWVQWLFAARVDDSELASFIGNAAPIPKANASGNNFRRTPQDFLLTDILQVDILPLHPMQFFAPKTEVTITSQVTVACFVTYSPRLPDDYV
jgi:hypothetical protein